jgi:hypothetical protein
MDGGCDLLLVETILIPKCQSSAFAIEEVKKNAILIFQLWFQERLPMLQEEHFLDKR